MDDQEAVTMMRKCREEILSLRRVIDALTVKADAYDQLRTILHLTQTEPSQGYSEDLAWALQTRINQIESEAQSVAEEKP